MLWSRIDNMSMQIHHVILLGLALSHTFIINLAR
jgi:hypothetical protein